MDRGVSEICGFLGKNGRICRKFARFFDDLCRLLINIDAIKLFSNRHLSGVELRFICGERGIKTFIQYHLTSFQYISKVAETQPFNDMI